jgi:hypothetical protein
MLNDIDKQTIITSFPNIKLSYENISHKKVYNTDMIFVIPEGKKCFAWFTYVNDKPSCLIIELGEDKNIVDVKSINACFTNEISYGTIFYGTLLYHLNNKFFSIEDIFICKGEIIERENWNYKMKKISNLLKNDLKQAAYNNSFVVFGLPIICKTYDELENKIKNVKYKIDSIQFRLYNRTNNYLCVTYDNYINEKQLVVLNKHIKPKIQEKCIENLRIIQPVKREVVFLIKPDIQNDIYYLYCLDNNFKEEQHSIAHIPDYNTSVMMNKLFRIIKENNNLDALEESDDEEEFESESLSKFVYLDKSYKMICNFNHKFKKWTPISLANEKLKIITSFELTKIYKIYEQNKKK